ncbi:hypothetical protein D3C81_526950 [compost metagenome]
MLTHTMPASMRGTRRIAFDRSLVHTLAPRPKGESFIMRSNCSSSSNGSTVTIGPKVSS